MSTLRYTHGGDYDAGNSIHLPIDSAPGETLHHERGTGSIQIDFVNGDVYIYATEDIHSGGIYANFSDNLTGASMTGGDKGDVLIGGSAADTIRGGAGDDMITGGSGADRLVGNAGADIFEFRRVSDFGVEAGHGALDVIKDFSGVNAVDGSGEGDKIDLSNIADFVLVSRFDHAGLAEVRTVQHGDHMIVYGDRDGDGRADFRFRVATDQLLVEDDFVLSKTVPASHPINAAPHSGAMIDLPGFGFGMHILEHLPIA